MGARQLEAHFGPGELRDTARGPRRQPIVASATLTDLESKGRALADALDAEQRAAIERANFTACLATTDVHEYGKVMVESVLADLAVTVVDGGISTDPQVLAQRACAGGADFIAISTYNGVALEFVHRLKEALADLGVTAPVFIGGKLNQVPENTNTSLPVDVSEDIRRAGALPCQTVSDMIAALVTLARETSGTGTV